MDQFMIVFPLMTLVAGTILVGACLVRDVLDFFEKKNPKKEDQVHTWEVYPGFVGTGVRD